MGRRFAISPNWSLLRISRERMSEPSVSESLLDRVAPKQRRFHSLCLHLTIRVQHTQSYASQVLAVRCNAISGCEFAAVNEDLRDQASPSRLMAGPAASAGIAVEVFVKRN